ncbi:hypothetical protein B0H13DRAFT_2129939, partial [Mycena leptocephala]
RVTRATAPMPRTRAGLSSLLWISATRPLILLFTEPTVLFFSLWISFAWGIMYSMFESILPVFEGLYGFNHGEAGLTFAGMTVGSLLGFATNFYQDSLYRKYFPIRGPEARLFAACGAALLFPTGMFIYAWGANAAIPWIVPVIGVTLFMWATFIMYLAVFTYLADCYGPYASSALAGQSLFRNLMGAASRSLRRRCTRVWGSTGHRPSSGASRSRWCRFRMSCYSSAEDPRESRFASTVVHQPSV